MGDLLLSDIWIINGIPGSGKSTTARALAQRFPRAAHIEGDKLQECIVSGAVWPGEQPVDEESRQIHLNVRNQCLLARSFAAAGFTPIIDYVVVNQERLAEYAQQLTGFTLRLVTLAPRVTVALQRDRDRPEKTVAMPWTYLDEIMAKELAGVGLRLDNSDLSVAQAVDSILEMAEASIVSA